MTARNTVMHGKFVVCNGRVERPMHPNACVINVFLSSPPQKLGCEEKMIPFRIEKGTSHRNIIWKGKQGGWF